VIFLSGMAQAPLLNPPNVIKQGGKLMMIMPMMIQKRFFLVFFVKFFGCGGGVNE